MKLSPRVLAKIAVPVVAGVANLATAYALIQVAGREQAGLAITIIGLLFLFSTIGAGAVSIQVPNIYLTRAESNSRKKTRLSAIFKIGLCLAVITSLAGGFAINQFVDFEFSPPLLCAVASVNFCRVFSRQVFVVMGRKIIGSVIEDYFQPILISLLIVSLWLGIDLTANGVLVLAIGVNLLFSTVWIRFAYIFINHNVYKKEYMRQILRLPIIFSQGIATFSASRLDILVVGPVFGLSAVADFTLLNRILNGMIVWRVLSFNQFVRRNIILTSKQNLLIAQSPVFIVNSVGQLGVGIAASILWIFLLSDVTDLSLIGGLTIIAGFSIASSLGPSVALANLQGKFAAATVIGAITVLTTIAIGYLPQTPNLEVWLWGWMLATLIQQLVLLFYIFYHYNNSK